MTDLEHPLKEFRREWWYIEVKKNSLRSIYRALEIKPCNNYQQKQQAARPKKQFVSEFLCE